MTKIIGLKELRENTAVYEKKVKQGESFLVVKRSKPIFKLVPLSESDEQWEEVVDFTKIKKGGVKIKDILSRL
jgi:prevent-host-death family protein